VGPMPPVRDGRLWPGSSAAQPTRRAGSCGLAGRFSPPARLDAGSSNSLSAIQLGYWCPRCGRWVRLVAGREDRPGRRERQREATGGRRSEEARVGPGPRGSPTPHHQAALGTPGSRRSGLAGKGFTMSKMRRGTEKGATPRRASARAGKGRPATPCPATLVGWPDVEWSGSPATCSGGGPPTRRPRATYPTDRGPREVASDRSRARQGRGQGQGGQPGARRPQKAKKRGRTATGHAAPRPRPSPSAMASDPTAQP